MSGADVHWGIIAALAGLAITPSEQTTKSIAMPSTNPDFARRLFSFIVSPQIEMNLESYLHPSLGRRPRLTLVLLNISPLIAALERVHLEARTTGCIETPSRTGELRILARNVAKQSNQGAVTMFSLQPKVEKC